MGMVAAICTQCGAAIEVDESKEAGICSHCGTAFITEKVINNYHIHNTTNVTNKIEHATINVKHGDDAGDIFKRYSAFIKQKKYSAIVKLLDKAQSQFPDSGIVQYCVADFLMTVRGYDDWLYQVNKGAADEVLDSGEKALDVGTFFNEFRWDNAVFDMKKLSDSLDKFEERSDDDICLEIKRMKISGTVNEGDVRRLIFRLPEVEGIDVYYSIDKKEEDYDGNRFDSAMSYWKARDDHRSGVDYWGQYPSAGFCARKTIEIAEDFLTDSERAQYADFIKSVNEKCDEFENLLMRRDKAKNRIMALQERIYKENKRRIKGGGNGKLKKFITTVVVLGIIAVAVVIIVKKFL